MSTKELLIHEIRNSPEEVLTEVLNFLKFLQQKERQERLETTLLSESSLQKDWLKPEEDKAWKDL